MKTIEPIKPVGVCIFNEDTPKIESSKDSGVFIDGKKLNGVTSFKIKSSEEGSELFIRLHVQPKG